LPRNASWQNFDSRTGRSPHISYRPIHSLKSKFFFIAAKATPPKKIVPHAKNFHRTVNRLSQNAAARANITTSVHKLWITERGHCAGGEN
jgi:hypothetical protein